MKEGYLQMTEEQKEVKSIKIDKNDSFLKYTSVNSVIDEIGEEIEKNYRATNSKIDQTINETNLAFDKVDKSIDIMKEDIISALEENEKERKKMSVLIIIALVGSIVLAGITIANFLVGRV